MVPLQKNFHVCPPLVPGHCAPSNPPPPPICQNFSDRRRNFLGRTLTLPRSADLRSGAISQSCTRNAGSETGAPHIGEPFGGRVKMRPILCGNENRACQAPVPSLKCPSSLGE